MREQRDGIVCIDKIDGYRPIAGLLRSKRSKHISVALMAGKGLA